MFVPADAIEKTQQQTLVGGGGEESKKKKKRKRSEDEAALLGSKYVSAGDLDGMRVPKREEGKKKKKGKEKKEKKEKKGKKGKERSKKRRKKGYGSYVNDEGEHMIATASLDQEELAKALRAARFIAVQDGEEAPPIENIPEYLSASQLEALMRAPAKARKRNAAAAASTSAYASAITSSRAFSHLTDSKIAITHDMDWDSVTIKGTSAVLSKPYLRLTSPPAPDTVRPPEVLEEALEYHVGEYDEGVLEYLDLCEQLKSIRQDLTVQRINNEFTIHVYETHARIALVNSDFTEYNQCQTQLKRLYESHPASGSVSEFRAYRILYTVRYEQDVELMNTLASLTPKDLKSKIVKHAMAVRSALALGDYTAFYRLLASAPRASRFLMEPMIPRVRNLAYRTLLRAYRPAIPLRLLASALGMEGDGPGAEAWAVDNFDAVVVTRSDNVRVVDVKSSVGKMRRNT